MQKVQNIILVDYENRQDLYLGHLNDDFKVIVFIGAQQNSEKLKKEIAEYNYESRVEYVNVLGVGKNSLDFYIAFTLGKLYASTQFNIVYILSKDKGFNPLIEHLRALGKNCIRIEDIHEVLNTEPLPPIEEPSLGYDYEDNR